MRKCCVCGCKETRKTVSYAELPVMQSFVCQDAEGARRLPKSRIDIYVCSRCGAVFNGSFFPELVCYSDQYDNSQDFSPAFTAYIEERISYILRYRKTPSAVLEIGCGKGRFLRKLAERTSARCSGYDTSYAGDREELGGRLQFYSQYFDGGRDTYDLIISRHVIEHIQNPVEMLSLIAGALDENGILYLETPSLEWILEHKIIYDFTYEHCSYFTMDTIKHLLYLGGLEFLEGEYAFSGQYLSILARRRAASPAEDQSFLLAGNRSFLCGRKEDRQEQILAPESMDELTARMDGFEKHKNAVIEKIRELLFNFRPTGNTAVWGAAGKGVLCCKLFDPAGELITCVADINPNKQGGFIPCTAHPIVAPEQLPAYGIKMVLAANGNYYQEIRSMMAEIDPMANVLNLEKMVEECS